MTISAVPATTDRLAKANECLDYLEVERERRNDPAFGTQIEHRIIWRELLELQLQDAEERITSMCTAAESALALLG